MTIQSINHNPLKNDTKYARHRSAGANEVYLNNVITSQQQRGLTLNTYNNATTFGADWGSCQVNRDLKAVRPLVYVLVAGSAPGGSLGSTMTQIIKNDMTTIWKDLAECMAHRGLGPGEGGHGVNAAIHTLHNPNGHELHILVYKGRPPATVRKPAHKGDRFYHFEMTDP